MSSEPKNAWFRDHLREWVETTLKEPFNELTDVQRSKLMARFFAEKVLGPRNPTLLPFADEDLDACVVDGKDDCGVDFISREGEVILIIQAKFSGGKKLTKRPHEEAADFEYFRSVLSRLKNFRTLQMSQPLRELAAEIDWDTDKFQLYYITLRQLTSNQQTSLMVEIEPIPDLPDLPDRTELYLLDENKLNVELRDTLSIDRSEAKTSRLLFTDNKGSRPWIRLGTEERTCYVGRISGAKLSVLFQENQSRLFSLNIRNYIGDNATNKAIRQTAVDAADDFFFYNNGISALATRITPDQHDERVLLCERLSIINGAQTIRSLHKAHVISKSATHEVQVLMRVTEFDAKKTAAEQQFLDNVTKYNNTQNAIKVSDFRSNDKVQFDLRKRFDALPSVGGKKFLYKNKRSGERESDRIVIGMEDFVKTLYAFRFGPDDVYGGTGHVFDATQNGGYTKLFGEGGEILPCLSGDCFSLYAGIWFACNQAKDIWRAKLREGKEPALERRWMFFYALGESIRVAYQHLGLDRDAALRSLSNPKWLKEPETGSTKKVLLRHCKVAIKGLVDAYRESSKDPVFTHRNWFRSQATLTSITEQIRSSWTLLADHGEDYVWNAKPEV
ncbi:MAG: AIPR family protein [Bryobacteraceae bacterium]